MVHRGHWVTLGICAVGGALVASTGVSGCRSDTSSSHITPGDDTTSSSSSGSGGGGVGGTATTGSGGGGGNGSGTGGAGGAGGVMPPPCDGQAATIYDVTNAPNATSPVGPGIKVKVTGVVAMSQKFLVAKSNSSGSCLWGVFVSAPTDLKNAILTETAPYSGTLVLSYGDKATVDPVSGNSFCPKLGGGPNDPPPNDAIPDDVGPGDVLDVIGKTDYFLLAACANQMNGATVAQRQISNSCSVMKTGTTAVPAPHTLTVPEITQLASPTDKAFHDMWGGVKVKVLGPTPVVPQMNAGMPDSVLNGFGQFFLQGSNLQVGDKIYYRGYLKATDKCHDGPKLTLPYTVDSVTGFSYLDYCTWSLAPNNKCTDLSPASEDCAAGGPGGVPLMCP